MLDIVVSRRITSAGFVTLSDVKTYDGKGSDMTDLLAKSGRRIFITIPVSVTCIVSANSRALQRSLNTVAVIDTFTDYKYDMSVFYFTHISFQLINRQFL